MRITFIVIGLAIMVFCNLNCANAAENNSWPVAKFTNCEINVKDHVTPVAWNKIIELKATWEVTEGFPSRVIANFFYARPNEPEKRYNLGVIENGKASVIQWAMPGEFEFTFILFGIDPDDKNNFVVLDKWTRKMIITTRWPPGME